MATYLYCQWLNHPLDCPKEMYSELDHHRFETRKIEIFASGAPGFASGRKTTRDTRLGIMPVPSLSEINKQHEFRARTITQAAFEAKWQQVTS